MSSERRSIEGVLADSVVPEGVEHNPNPPEQVAANRARFEAKQRELQRDRLEAAEHVQAVQTEVELQYRQAIADPAHQAFIPEQIAHELHDPLHGHGGQEARGSDILATPGPQNADTARLVPLPTTPQAAEETRSNYSGGQ